MIVKADGKHLPLGFKGNLTDRVSKQCKSHNTWLEVTLRIAVEVHISSDIYSSSVQGISQNVIQLQH
jgi:hypothetical protein